MGTEEIDPEIMEAAVCLLGAFGAAPFVVSAAFAFGSAGTGLRSTIAFVPVPKVTVARGTCDPKGGLKN